MNRIDAARDVLDFLAAVQAQMEIHGHSSDWLAKEVGVSETLLMSMLYGETTITAKTMFVLCRALNGRCDFQWPP